MRTIRTVTVGGIATVAAAMAMWTAPAWGQSSRMPIPGPPVSASVGTTMAGSATAGTAMAGDAAAGSADLTRQLAAMRVATAKYATNLAKAKADGYGIITMMMPNMGFHYLNMGISSFNIRKPQILVYEHTGGKWQLGALEWIFPSMPKNPPVPNATFGQFPAACHYNDGSFIPHKNMNTCPKTSPKTGSKFHFWHPLLITMHVWIWYPNPAGLFSSTNPLVAPFNGG
jgi:hypothetical protein